jgi:hypothetical protein
MDVSLVPAEAESEREPLCLKHRFWLRLIMGVVGILALFGTIWAAQGYPGTGDPDAFECRAGTVLVMHRHGRDFVLVHRSEQKGEQGGADDDDGRPSHGLGRDLHVQSVGVGDHQRVQARRHCGEQAVGGG